MFEVVKVMESPPSNHHAVDGDANDVRAFSHRDDEDDKPQPLTGDGASPGSVTNSTKPSTSLHLLLNCFFEFSYIVFCLIKLNTVIAERFLLAV